MTVTARSVWPVRAVGIDLGASAVWCVAAEDGRFVDGRVFAVDELDALRRWCGDAAVAIDAPAAPSEGHEHVDQKPGKFRRARCAEVALARAGHWVSWVAPGAAGPFRPWMAAGFAVWEALAGRERLEVFPHAVFRELAGVSLARKTTLAGLRQRAALLDWLPPGAELWGHDGLDAAAACTVATDFVAGRARRLACADHPEGSAMWLPAERRT
jgi:hypothetical protein